MKKGLTYVKLTQFHFQECNKTHQNHGHLISNWLMNIDNNFCHTSKIHEYGLQSFHVLILCIWNFGIL